MERRLGLVGRGMAFRIYGATLSFFSFERNERKRVLNLSFCSVCYAMRVRASCTAIVYGVATLRSRVSGGIMPDLCGFALE